MRVFSKVDFSTNCKKNNLDTSIQNIILYTRNE